MNKRVIYIGGSPCSGKSTIAERLSRDYNAYWFKADDYLDELIAEAAAQHAGSCKKVSEMTADEIWMQGYMLSQNHWHRLPRSYHNPDDTWQECTPADRTPSLVYRCRIS